MEVGRVLATSVLNEIEIVGGRESAEEAESKSTSIFSLDGETLEQRRILSHTEASTQSPGFYGFGTTPRLIGFTIRGIGNNQFNNGRDASVGLRLDGVYFAR
jgi:iron complex outermembrane recepter protein